MTKYLIILGTIVLASCSKKADANALQSEVSEKLDYDTIAIDSFSAGATPANMAPKVIVIKDTAAAAKKKALEAQIKELEKKKADEKKKAEDKEKEKAKNTEKAKEKAKEEATQTAPPTTPTTN
ncbi:hypothetical protein [Soonwooa sp.]|uniref:hypothetical protein n=1 Tax=Soonwooa sp. TaxID=1938592 RepID=UPI002637A2FB|nr:hypothetical protein [Soonwooa sp.]